MIEWWNPGHHEETAWDEILQFFKLKNDPEPVIEYKILELSKKQIHEYMKKHIDKNKAELKSPNLTPEKRSELKEFTDP